MINNRYVRCALLVMACVGSATVAAESEIRQDLGGMQLKIQNNTSGNAADVDGIDTSSPAIDGVRVTNHDRVAARCAMLGGKNMESLSDAQIIAPGESATVRMRSGTIDAAAALSLKCERQR